MSNRRRTKAPAGGPAREPLSHLLGTRAKVSCLRVLASTEGLITQREVARRAGMQHRTAQLALEELIALGVVRRVEGGRDFLVGFSDAHALSVALRQLFQSEAAFFLALRQRLAAVAATAPRSAAIKGLILFGSVARGDDRIGSDVDVLVVTRSEAAIDSALAHVSAAGGQVREVFGYAVRAIVYTEAELRSRWRRREAPLPDIVRDHIVLAGPALGDLLDG